MSSGKLIEDGLRLSPTAQSERKDFRSWLVSLLFHSAFLVVVALWIIPGIPRPSVHVFQGTLGPDRNEAPQFSIARVEVFEPVPIAEDLMVQIAVPLSVLISNVTVDDLAEPKMMDAESLNLLTEPPTSTPTGNDQASSRHVSGTDAIGRSISMSGAISRVGDSIRSELLQGDTLVVWLLDASKSLGSNRSAMARHTGKLYKSIGALSGGQHQDRDGHRLLSSVVAFGNDCEEIVAPTEIGSQAINGMLNIPVDASGRENVMRAIDCVVDLYVRQREHTERISIIVMTDESGDDADGLEDTIRKCHDTGVAVHVIGPTATMGSQQGWQHRAIRHGSINYSFWLAVNRGPESPLPERLCLPYWHQSSLPPWEHPDARSIEDGNWYGSAYRERLLSGFGPYALTRLTLQTGGTYTLFDRRWNGFGEGQYRLEVLRDYVPEYDSMDQYLASISQRPLRQFVVDAAALSLEDPKLFAPPRTTFIGERSPYYPFNVKRVHYSPSEFGGRIASLLHQERLRVAQASMRLSDLIQRLNDPSIDWDDEFAGEKSKRWRAWFDLTKGRLLATQARQLEYLTVTAEAAGAISADSNSVTLIPSDEIRVSVSEALIYDARACLERCISDHPQTPWEDMARWELEHPFGLRIEQASVPAPPPSIIAGPLKTPTDFEFPSL